MEAHDGSSFTHTRPTPGSVGARGAVARGDVALRPRAERRTASVQLRHGQRPPRDRRPPAGPGGIRVGLARRRRRPPRTPHHDARQQRVVRCPRAVPPDGGGGLLPAGPAPAGGARHEPEQEHRRALRRLPRPRQHDPPAERPLARDADVGRTRPRRRQRGPHHTRRHRQRRRQRRRRGARARRHEPARRRRGVRLQLPALRRLYGLPARQHPLRAPRPGAVATEPPLARQRHLLHAAVHHAAAPPDQALLLL